MCSHHFDLGETQTVLFTFPAQVRRERSQFWDPRSGSSALGCEVITLYVGKETTEGTMWPM